MFSLEFHLLKDKKGFILGVKAGPGRLTLSVLSYVWPKSWMPVQVKREGGNVSITVPALFTLAIAKAG